MSATTNRHSEMQRLEARLGDLERKLDELLEAHRRRAEFFEEMTPIAREAMDVFGQRLEAMERKGYFAFGREALRVLDRIVENYSEQDVRALGDHIVTIMDTVRNVTQPEVLRIANEAVGAISHPEEVEPVGVLGMLRSTRDDDVKRGMAVLLEVLRHVGRAAERVAEQGGGQVRAPRPPADSRPDAPSEPRPAPATRPAPSAATPPAASTPAESAAAEGDGWALDDDGHLADPSQWDREFAAAMAAHLGLGQLSEEQWKVVEWARAEWEQTGAAPNIRRITTGMGMETRRLYELFPKAPARTIAKVAGIPKPVGCL